MIQLTPTAISKVQEILRFAGAQTGRSADRRRRRRLLRLQLFDGVRKQPRMLDKTYSFEGLKVFVDQASLLYLDGAEVDYVESLEGSGFKFNNPNMKSTCGCGSSFSA